MELTGWQSKSQEDATRSEEAEKNLRKDDYHERSEGHHSFGISVIVSCLPLPPQELVFGVRMNLLGEGKKISSSVIRRSVSLRSRMTWQCGRAKHLSLSD